MRQACHKIASLVEAYLVCGAWLVHGQSFGGRSRLLVVRVVADRNPAADSPAAASGFDNLAAAHCVAVALGYSLAAVLALAVAAVLAAVAPALAVRILRLAELQGFQSTNSTH